MIVAHADKRVTIVLDDVEAMDFLLSCALYYEAVGGWLKWLAYLGLAVSEFGSERLSRLTRITDPAKAKVTLDRIFDGLKQSVHQPKDWTVVFDGSTVQVTMSIPDALKVMTNTSVLADQVKAKRTEDWFDNLYTNFLWAIPEEVIADAADEWATQIEAPKIERDRLIRNLTRDKAARRTIDQGKWWH